MSKFFEKKNAVFLFGAIVITVILSSNAFAEDPIIKISPKHIVKLPASGSIISFPSISGEFEESFEIPDIPILDVIISEKDKDSEISKKVSNLQGLKMSKKPVYKKIKHKNRVHKNRASISPN